jgi:hypothetical protein
MNITKGHGLLIRIPKFANGSTCQNKRTFLVIDINEEKQLITIIGLWCTMKHMVMALS